MGKMLPASIWLVSVTTVYFVVLAAGSDLFTYTPVVPVIKNGNCTCTKVESNKSYDLPSNGTFSNCYNSTKPYQNNSNIYSCSNFIYSFSYLWLPYSEKSDSCSNLSISNCSQSYDSVTGSNLMACRNQYNYSNSTAAVGTITYAFKVDNSTGTFTDSTSACSQNYNFTLNFMNQKGPSNCNCLCPA